ncbi:MAG: glycosyltransferase family 2 protein [Cyanobacteria bacterium P01_A01_bin.3]
MTHPVPKSDSEQSGAIRNPLVSVIVPAYNVEQYLKYAIDSALNQTLANIEVIVVDDASNDSTLQVAQACAATDDRVKVIASPANRGAAVARNQALDTATGDWVAILDADDWFSPKRLEALLTKADEYSADMVADDLSYVRNLESEPWTSFAQLNGNLYTSNPTEIDPLFYVREDSRLWSTNGVSPGFLKPIIRRSLLNNNNIRYKDYIRLGQDFFFFLDCLLAEARYIFYPEAYYFYRARPDSLITKSQRERWLQAERGLSEVLKDRRVAENFELQKALLAKLNVCTKKRQYASVVEPLRKKQYLKAMFEMIVNPYFFVRAIQRLWDKNPLKRIPKKGTMAKRLTL